VMELEVAELVGEDGQDLARAHRLEQGVEQHDALLPEEPGEVGVAVGCPLPKLDLRRDVDLT
jgi:hypothetical protein